MALSVAPISEKVPLLFALFSEEAASLILRDGGGGSPQSSIVIPTNSVPVASRHSFCQAARAVGLCPFSTWKIILDSSNHVAPESFHAVLDTVFDSRLRFFAALSPVLPAESAFSLLQAVVNSIHLSLPYVSSLLDRHVSSLVSLLSASLSLASFSLLASSSSPPTSRTSPPIPRASAWALLAFGSRGVAPAVSLLAIAVPSSGVLAITSAIFVLALNSSFCRACSAPSRNARRGISSSSHLPLPPSGGSGGVGCGASSNARNGVYGAPALVSSFCSISSSRCVIVSAVEVFRASAAAASATFSSMCSSVAAPPSIPSSFSSTAPFPSTSTPTSTPSFSSPRLLLCPSCASSSMPPSSSASVCPVWSCGIHPTSRVIVLVLVSVAHALRGPRAAAAAVAAGHVEFPVCAEVRCACGDVSCAGCCSIGAASGGSGGDGVADDAFQGGSGGRRVGIECADPCTLLLSPLGGPRNGHLAVRSHGGRLSCVGAHGSGGGDLAFNTIDPLLAVSLFVSAIGGDGLLPATVAGEGGVFGRDGADESKHAGSGPTVQREGGGGEYERGSDGSSGLALSISEMFRWGSVLTVLDDVLRATSSSSDYCGGGGVAIAVPGGSVPPTSPPPSASRRFAALVARLFLAPILSCCTPLGFAPASPSEPSSPPCDNDSSCSSSSPSSSASSRSRRALFCRGLKVCPCSPAASAALGPWACCSRAFAGAVAVSDLAVGLLFAGGASTSAELGIGKVPLPSSSVSSSAAVRSLGLLRHVAVAISLGVPFQPFTTTLWRLGGALGAIRSFSEPGRSSDIDNNADAWLSGEDLPPTQLAACVVAHLSFGVPRVAVLAVDAPPPSNSDVIAPALSNPGPFGAAFGCGSEDAPAPWFGMGPSRADPNIGVSGSGGAGETICPLPGVTSSVSVRAAACGENVSTSTPHLHFPAIEAPHLVHLPSQAVSDLSSVTVCIPFPYGSLLSVSSEPNPARVIATAIGAPTPLFLPHSSSSVSCLPSITSLKRRRGGGSGGGLQVSQVGISIGDMLAAQQPSSVDVSALTQLDPSLGRSPWHCPVTPSAPSSQTSSSLTSAAKTRRGDFLERAYRHRACVSLACLISSLPRSLRPTLVSAAAAAAAAISSGKRSLPSPRTSLSWSPPSDSSRLRHSTSSSLSSMVSPLLRLLLASLSSSPSFASAPSTVGLLGLAVDVTLGAPSTISSVSEDSVSFSTSNYDGSSELLSLGADASCLAFTVVRLCASLSSRGKPSDACISSSSPSSLPSSSDDDSILGYCASRRRTSASLPPAAVHMENSLNRGLMDGPKTNPLSVYGGGVFGLLDSLNSSASFASTTTSVASSGVSNQVPRESPFLEWSSFFNAVVPVLLALLPAIARAGAFASSIVESHVKTAAPVGDSFINTFCPSDRISHEFMSSNLPDLVSRTRFVAMACAAALVAISDLASGVVAAFSHGKSSVAPFLASSFPLSAPSSGHSCCLSTSRRSSSFFSVSDALVASAGSAAALGIALARSAPALFVPLASMPDAAVSLAARTLAHSRRAPGSVALSLTLLGLVLERAHSSVSSSGVDASAAAALQHCLAVMSAVSEASVPFEQFSQSGDIRTTNDRPPPALSTASSASAALVRSVDSGANCLPGGSAKPSSDAGNGVPVHGIARGPSPCSVLSALVSLSLAPRSAGVPPPVAAAAAGVLASYSTCVAIHSAYDAARHLLLRNVSSSFGHELDQHLPKLPTIDESFLPLNPIPPPVPLRLFVSGAAIHPVARRLSSINVVFLVELASAAATSSCEAFFPDAVALLPRPSEPLASDPSLAVAIPWVFPPRLSPTPTSSVVGVVSSSFVSPPSYSVDSSTLPRVKPSSGSQAWPAAFSAVPLFDTSPHLAPGLASSVDDVLAALTSIGGASGSCYAGLVSSTPVAPTSFMHAAGDAFPSLAFALSDGAAGSHAHTDIVSRMLPARQSSASASPTTSTAGSAAGGAGSLGFGGGWQPCRHGPLSLASPRGLGSAQRVWALLAVSLWRASGCGRVATAPALVDQPGANGISVTPVAAPSTALASGPAAVLLIALLRTPGVFGRALARHVTMWASMRTRMLSSATPTGPRLLRVKEEDMSSRADSVLEASLEAGVEVALSAGDVSACCCVLRVVEASLLLATFVTGTAASGWDPLESTCRHASLSIL